jgi:hypothetical protein
MIRGPLQFFPHPSLATSSGISQIRSCKPYNGKGPLVDNVNSGFKSLQDCRNPGIIARLPTINHPKRYGTPNHQSTVRIRQKFGNTSFRSIKGFVYFKKPNVAAHRPDWLKKATRAAIGRVNARARLVGHAQFRVNWKWRRQKPRLSIRHWLLVSQTHARTHHQLSDRASSALYTRKNRHVVQYSVEYNKKSSATRERQG